MGPVVFWVVVAAVLGGLVMLSRRGPEGRGPGDAGVVSLGLDLAGVTALEAGTDGRLRIERAAGGRWFVAWGEGDAARRWPADDERARAGLRVLASAVFSERTADAGIVEFGAVTVHQADGARTIRWSGDPIAGRVAAEIEHDGGTHAVWMEHRLARALETENLMQWRDARLMSLGSRVMEIEVELPGKSVRLVQEAGVWRIDGAGVLAVNDAEVQRTLDAIASIEAQQLEAAPDDGPPAATIRVVGIDGAERTLSVLGAVNAAGTVMAARVSGTDGGQDVGPIGATIKGEPLGVMSPDPDAYLLGTAIDGARVDVATVELLSRSGERRALATRSIDGWRTEADAERMAALVGVLSDVRASSVGDGSDAESVGVIRLRDAALAQPIELVLGKLPGGAFCVVARGDALTVSFEYADAETQATLGWAAGLTR